MRELLTSEVRPHFPRLVKDIHEDAVVTLDDDDGTMSGRKSIMILKLYKAQYDNVVHGNLETPSYHLDERLHWSTIFVNYELPLTIPNKQHVYTLTDSPTNDHIIIRTNINGIDWQLHGIDIEGSVLPQLVQSLSWRDKVHCN